MTTSKTIAALLGPSMIAIGISEWMNLGILAANNTPSDVYLNGGLLFVAGLAIVRVHNRWRGGWPVVVTLTGWVALSIGMIRMIGPASSSLHGVEENATAVYAVYAMLIVMLVVGAFLTFKGYRPDDSKTPVAKR